MRVLGLASSLVFLPNLAGAASPDLIRGQKEIRVDRTAVISVGTDGLRLERLMGVLEARRNDFGWKIGDGLVLSATSRPLMGRSRDQGEIVHVHGSVGGVPINRPMAYGLIDRDGTVRLLVNEGPVGPLLSATGAKVGSSPDALTHLAASRRPGSVGAKQAELVIVAGDQVSRLAWRIDPPFDAQHLTNPIFLVDAVTGEIEIEYDHFRTARVNAFEYNPTRTPTAGTYDLIEIDPSPSSLSGPYFRSVNCINPGGNACSSAATAMADAAGDFLYPVPDVTNPDDNVQPDDVYSEISMYYHADKFLEHLFGFGFPGLPCHSQGGQATLVANYKRYDSAGDWTPYDNAFYSGSCSQTMTFGQGTQVDFAYDGDVVYHELGHGVVAAQRQSGLGGVRRLPEALAVDAGGLNEAIADFVSSSYAGDPVVADYVGEYWDRLSETKAIRDNSNDFVCPHDLVGEVHLDGEPFAALMWFAFVEYGNDVIPAVLDTTTALASNAILGEAASVFAAMVEMHVDANAGAFVENMANERGLVDCLRVTSPERLRREMFVRGNSGYTPHAPPPLQLVVEAPADATEATVTYEAVARGNSFGDDPGDIDLGLLIREESPMTFAYTSSTGGYSVTVDAEQTLEHIADGLTFPVTGGASIYLGFVALNGTETKIQNIEVTFDGSDDTGDSDDDSDTGEDDGGTGTEDGGADTTDDGASDDLGDSDGGSGGTDGSGDSGDPGDSETDEGTDGTSESSGSGSEAGEDGTGDSLGDGEDSGEGGETDDAGDGPDDGSADDAPGVMGDESGCTCRSAKSPSTIGLMGFLLVAMGRRRRARGG